MLSAGLLLAGMGTPPARAEQPAAALQARYVALQDQLSHNAYRRPLFLDSTEAKDGLKGDLFVVIDHPFATVSQALQVMEHWADILILHLNVKGCRVVSRPAGRTLLVSIGRKNDEPLDQAYPVSFGYRVAAAQADYLHILLHADTGPMGSRNYEIALEAVPLKAGRTFIHLAYSYDYGLAARLAMKGYLATIGSDKVGFSATASPPGGAAVLVNGVRGVVERNTMRYYLAIEAFLGALAVPAADQLEKRLHDWFAATEQFPVQLHELDEAVYLAMKRKEVRQQPSGPDPSG
ncbi:hypothetical protein [Opitutus sp. GAS368]|uniref:hypothetical protein n=1 Tax=Opitutus sp. GAS368 TaxID=1882749 RepID=UPI0018D41E26|nr:hypothetical protein [Opitutus sp. GAS368]